MNVFSEALRVVRVTSGDFLLSEWLPRVGLLIVETHGPEITAMGRKS